MQVQVILSIIKFYFLENNKRLLNFKKMINNDYA
jgi:hypothetical protein